MPRNTMRAPRNGSWIQTYTGIQFWPLDPRPEEIEIRDIAHALSLLCRFNGHCRVFYVFCLRRAVKEGLPHTEIGQYGGEDNYC